MGAAQVTQIRVAGDPTYDTRYSFIEFTTPEEARPRRLPVTASFAVVFLLVARKADSRTHISLRKQVLGRALNADAMLRWCASSQKRCAAQAGTALLLDGMNVFERQIRVSMARGGSGPGVVRSNDPDRVQRTIHVGGLPFEEISEETLAEYFAHVGEVRTSRSCWLWVPAKSAAAEPCRAGV